MNFKLPGNTKNPPPRVEPSLQREVPVDLDAITRDLEAGTNASPPNLGHLKYAPPAVRNAPAVRSAPASSSYADVLEQVRALSVKAIDTYGNKVTEEVEQVVRQHLEIVLQLAEREKEIKDHYRSQMNALKKDAHDFTAHARNDLERIAGVTPVVAKFNEEPAPPEEQTTAAPDEEVGTGKSKK